MPNLTLTTTPQSISNSDVGIIISSSGLPFLYGFGDTAPIHGITFKEDDEVLDYRGENGLIWVWRNSDNQAQSISYFISDTPVKVSLTDVNGYPIIADPTGGLDIISELQSSIHRGNAYSFDTDGEIPISSSLYFVGIVGDKQVHFDNVTINLQKGAVRLWLYESPTLTDNGTPESPINMNFASINTSSLSLYSAPTITDNGTKKASIFFPLTGGGANTSPQEGGIASGRVLKTNTTYLFRLENLDNSECSFGIDFIWHDSDYILG